MLQNGKEYIQHTSHLGKTSIKDAAENLEPAAMEKLNWLIHLQHVRGEINSCKDLIKNEIARSQGKNEYVYYKQGILLKQEGNVQLALDTFQKCLKLNQQNILILREVAKCLFEMGRFHLALNAFLEAEQLSKNPDWQLYYYTARTYMKLGNSEKSVEYAHKSAKAGKQEESYALLMKILISVRDFPAAIVVANTGVEACPDSVTLLTESGLLYLKIGQSQYAFERLSQALALDQTCAKALLGIGYITHKHDEYDVALSKYKIAVLYEPESVALWNNIGMCFYAKQKYIAAVSCLKRGLWLAPLNWKLLYNLGLVHLATGQPASGFNFACAAVNLRPDLGECFALLGHTLFELKDTENALRATKQAHSLVPTDATFTANTALLLHLAGAQAEYEEYINKFMKLCEDGHTISQEASNLVEILKANITSNINNDKIPDDPKVSSEEHDFLAPQEHPQGQVNQENSNELQDDEV
ncbi:Bardet-Biedl syndrome 4 protein-like isoform X2 [Euwallacea fornicatus]|uniref:Bardet-Biedl syndrome 4 protein-like isoform X2 n=1 Tax=Euwallacea fornicatus TaxID=995702 RepID=UPI00338E2185